ncbi:Protein fam49a, partial [Coelomomyces lativittatus]
PNVCTAEEELVTKLRKLESSYPKILNEIKAYAGCEDAIRLSISKPSPENDDHAWNAVLPCVTTLKSFFDFACKFGA